MKLPTNWQIKRLEKLVQFSSGGTPSKAKSEYWAGDIPWISAATMHQQEITTSQLKITENGLKAGSKLAKKNDLLLLVRGSMLWKKIPICICKRDVAFNQDVKAMSTTTEIEPNYLLYWFLGHQRFLLNKVVGTGIGAGKLDFDELKALDIILPPFEEQKAIAGLLVTWDEAIEKAEQLIKVKEKEFKYLKQKLIAKKINNKKKLINQVASIAKKKKLLSLDNKILLTVKLHCLGIEKNDRIKPKLTKGGRPYFKHSAGDFLIGRQNFHNGGFGIIPKELDGGITSNAISSLELDQTKILNDFLWFQFSDPNYYKKVGHLMDGTGQKELSDKQILKLKILCPDIEEQKKVVAILNTAQDEINLLKKLLEKYKTQKRGLMQKLLTGKWRIKN